MKTLIFAALLLSSTLALATTGPMTDCSGKTSDGRPVSIFATTTLEESGGQLAGPYGGYARVDIDAQTIERDLTITAISPAAVTSKKQRDFCKIDPTFEGYDGSKTATGKVNVKIESPELAAPVLATLSCTDTDRFWIRCPKARRR